MSLTQAFQGLHTEMQEINRVALEEGIQTSLTGKLFRSLSWISFLFFFSLVFFLLIAK